MAANTFKNYAFISYQRKDEIWAKWLQRKLENYKLPSVAHRESSDKGTYIRPVFRDKTDLTAGILSEELKKELLQSRFLIVICSPNSAISDWVNEEIKSFIEDKRVRAIIPFIIKGKPRAISSEDECFPQALKNIPANEELLGVDVRDGGRDKAFIRTVSYMLGVRFDELWQRHKRRTKRLHIIEAAACLFALTFAFGVYDYKRIKVQYYADYVDVHGIPDGILELTKEQVSRKNRCWQFEYERIPFGQSNFYSWRVKKVSYVNSAKVPQQIIHTELTDRYPIQHLYYNSETGDVSRVNYCDEKDNVLVRYQYSERDGQIATIADLINSQEQLGSAFVGGSHLSMTMNEMDENQQKTNIVRYYYIRDLKGHIVQQTFHSNNDYQLNKSIICDAEGIFGLSFSLDSLGRRIKVQYLGIDGQVISTKKGIAGKKYEYDEWGNIKTTIYLDIEGNPILNEKLWASCKNISDEYGNIVETRCYGVDGKPCIMQDGDSFWKSVYDLHGNLIESISYDLFGNQTTNKKFFSKVTYSHDKHGNTTTTKYYDENGNPCIISAGFSTFRVVYDKRNNPIIREYYNQDGHLCLNKNGFARSIYKYNSKNQLVEIIVYDENGNRCICTDDLFSRCSYNYDKKGNLIQWESFSIDDSLCISKDGFAKCIISYDDKGNISELMHFDNHDVPCLNKSGVFKIVYKRDEYGNIVDECYFGTDLERCVNKNGVSRVLSTYDGRGKKTSIKYLGVNNEPCLSNEGIASISYCYDSKGNCIEEGYYDIKNEPSIDSKGIVKIKNAYDEKGNMTEWSSLGINGELVLDEKGVAKYCMEYDNKGNIIMTSHYGVSNEPCLNAEGVFKYIRSFDNRGHEISTSCFDINGEPTVCSSGFYRIDCIYNDFNYCIQENYFGIDNKPCMMNYGYAKKLTSYDKRGYPIREDYFDINDRPCLDIFGRSSAIAEYDDYGNQTKISTLGTDGNPIRFESEGWATSLSTFNDKGLKVANAFFDEIEKPCMIDAGFHRYTIEYDERGNKIKISYYDTIGNLCIGNEGWAIVQNKYDEHNNRTETSYYGKMGEPVNMEGYHKQVYVLDKFGYIAETKFYDNEMNLLSKLLFSTIIVNSELFSAASYKNIPIGSIIIQYNEWFIGMSEDSYRAISNKCRYTSKDYYYITPEGEIGYFHVDKGLSGLWVKDCLIEEDYANELIQKLEDWKKDDNSMLSLKQ